MKRFSSAARFNGNKQYPSRQMLWKKLIVPPSNWPFIAIIAPPSHTITKTISNSRVLSSALVAAESTLQNKMSRGLPCKHKAEEKRTPKIPISDLFSFISFSCDRLYWIDNYPQFGPDPHKVSFLTQINR